MSLSDDPEAVDMLNSMKQAAVMLGANPSDNINVMFDSLLNKVVDMRTKLNEEGA